MRTAHPASPLRPAVRLGYQPAIDGLRAVSVVAVLLYHGEVTGLPGGFLGVEVFFVVSGYLITSLLLAEQRSTGRVSLRRFWFRRARRLLPALYLLLIAVTAWALLFADDAVGQLRGDVLASIFYVNNWWQIFEEQSYFVDAGRPPLLRHLWSLAVEEQFYLLWPPVLAFALRRFARPRVVLAIVGTALASTVWMAMLYSFSADATGFTDPTRVYYGTDTRLSGLLLGSAFAFAWAPWRLSTRTGRGAGAVIDGAGLAGLAVLGWSFLRVNEFDAFVYQGGFLVVDAATLLVIAAAVHPVARVVPTLGWEPLRWIGLRSYALYLWHWPVYQLTRPDLDVPLHGLPLLALRLALTFALADASYRWVERPVRDGVLGRFGARVRAAHGAHRRVLAARATLVGTGTVVLVAVLAVGLAGARTPEPEVPGITGDPELEAIARNDDPAAPVVQATPDPMPTTAPSDPGPQEQEPSGGEPSTTDPPVPTTTVPPGGSYSVLAIGDSVMLGAQRSLEAAMPGILVDAKVSRQFSHAIEVARYYRDNDLLRDVVVIHMGTNGSFSAEQLDEMLRTLGDRPVVLLTARVPRPWESLVNRRMVEGAQRWPNAILVDWRGLAGSHDDYFASDGFHLERVGAEFYADLIRAQVEAATRPAA